MSARDYEFSDLQGIGDVSWCDDQIDKHDVEYVRADLAAPAAQGEAQVPFGWAVLDKKGCTERVISRVHYEFAHIEPLIRSEPDPKELLAYLDREYKGAAPHRLVTLYTTPQPSAPGVVSDAQGKPTTLFSDTKVGDVDDAVAVALRRTPNGQGGESTDYAAGWRDACAYIAARRVEPAAQPSADDAPIPMLLFCPQCSMQHIDAPETPRFSNDDTGASEEYRETMFPAWTNPPHRSHLCHGCGHIWRPADVATTGVAALKTSGKRDGSPIPAPPADARDGGAPTAIAWMQKWNLDLIASLPEGQSAHVGLSREPSEANNVPVYIDAPRATELLNSAIQSMQNLHEQIRPDDECEDGIVPAAALRKFVDEHAGLLYESSKMANSYRDTERLSFICENISGKEARRLGIVWSSGSLEDKRAAIDSAMGAGGGK